MLGLGTTVEWLTRKGHEQPVCIGPLPASSHGLALEASSPELAYMLRRAEAKQVACSSGGIRLLKKVPQVMSSIPRLLGKEMAHPPQLFYAKSLLASPCQTLQEAMAISRQPKAPISTRSSAPCVIHLQSAAHSPGTPVETMFSSKGNPSHPSTFFYRTPSLFYML